VWSGVPLTFQRDLSSEELMANYSKSYQSGAANFEEFSMYPHDFQEEGLKEGELSMQEYADRQYFKQFDA
jgi:hypothetical protein